MPRRGFHRLLVLLLVLLAGCGPTNLNRPPVAEAGSDVHVFLGDSATLDASQSSDPEDGSLDFEWTTLSAPAGSAFAPGMALSSTVSFPFAPDVAGTYVISVAAIDPKGSSASDLVIVEAQPPLRVIHLVPADGSASVSGLAPVVAVFDAPIRPWTAVTLIVEDVTDPLAPVAVLGNAAIDPAGAAIVFTPVAAWTNGAGYRVTVPVGGPIGLDGAPLASEVVASFTASATDTEPPRVVPGGISPAPGETAAPLSTVIDVFFSEAIDPATAALAFSLAQQAGPVQDGAVELAAGGVVARFVPADTTPDPDAPQALAAATDWAFGIAATLTDLAGNALDGDGSGTPGTPYASTFRTVSGTDTTVPALLSVSPFRGATAVSVKLPSVLTFSEPVLLNAGAVVLGTGGAAGVTGTLALVAGNRVAIFSPDANLATGTRYDLSVLAGSVQDLAGNALPAFDSFFFTGTAAPPLVFSALPDGAAVGETLTVAIVGEDFVNGAVALIAGGGVLVSSTTWISETELQCNVTLAPSAAFGVRSIVVVNPDGQQGNGLGLFNVRRRPPSIAAVTPDEAARGTTLTVTVTGADFDCGSANPPLVSLNDVAIADAVANCLGSTSATATTIEANFTIPAGATLGLHTLTVTNDDGNFDDAPAAFFVDAAPPNVTSLALATSGRRGDTVTTRVNGTDFLATPTVSFGAGVGVSSVTFNSSIQLTVDEVISASAALGTRTVTVTNPDGKNDTLAAAFTVLRAIPKILSAAPPQGSRLDPAFDVTLTGDDFDCSQSGMAIVPTVSFGAGVQINSVSCSGSTSDSADTLIVNLQVLAGAALGARSVFVTNAGDGTAGQGTGLFTVFAQKPTVTAASPPVPQGQTVEVAIGGTNFLATPVVTTTIPGATVGTVTFVSAAEVRAVVTVPLSTAAGTYGVSVTNPDGQGASANVAVVDPALSPVISGVSPPRSAVGTTLSVIVTGANFQNAATVSFVGQGIDITNNGTTFVDSGTLSVSITISGGSTDFSGRDVTVTNPVGPAPTDVEPNVFLVTGLPPTVTAISSPSGAQGTTTPGVSITGTNFRAGAVPSLTGGAVNGITLTNVNVVSSTQITVDIAVSANASSGFRGVTVTNTDSSTATLANGFQVLSVGSPAPSSITRAPFLVAGDGARRDDGSSLRQGEAATFHLLGTDFDPDATAFVSGAGVTVSNVVVVDATHIKVDLTAACGDVAPGRRDVTVLNPTDGKTGTLVDGLGVRVGVVINEVTTSPSTNHGFSPLSQSHEIVELFNGSLCTRSIQNWRLDMVDTGGVTGYEVGAGTERYSAGASALSFPPGAYMLIDRPDNNNNDMADNVYIALTTATGRFADDVEIGDNEENDGTDGGPAPGNNGGSSAGAATEMVGRCSNGTDTENDQNDFYQDELAGTQMAATDLLGNDTQCPVCANGLDDDNDGWIDLLDGGCSSAHLDGSEAGGAAACSDGVDNDGDFLPDAADPECQMSSDNDEVTY